MSRGIRGRKGDEEKSRMKECRRGGEVETKMKREKGYEAMKVYGLGDGGGGRIGVIAGKRREGKRMVNGKEGREIA